MGEYAMYETKMKYDIKRTVCVSLLEIHENALV